jgi:hypothetical protein
MMDDNGNKSAVGNTAQAIDRAEKTNDYKAHRVSVAPMMDWATDAKFMHNVK